MKNVAWKLVPSSFIFQRILCKKEFEEVGKQICPNFDSFAVTYLILVASKISFSNRGCV